MTFLKLLNMVCFLLKKLIIVNHKQKQPHGKRMLLKGTIISFDAGSKIISVNLEDFHITMLSLPDTIAKSMTSTLPIVLHALCRGQPVSSEHHGL